MGETEEEKVTKPSEEEEKAKEPSDVGEAVKMFQKEQAEKPSDKETEEKTSPAEEEKPEEKEEEEEEVEEEKEKETLKPSEKALIPSSLHLNKEGVFVNEKGEPSPFMINVSGEDVAVDTLEALRTKAQQGHHYSQEMKKLNEERGEIEKGTKTLKTIFDEIELARKEKRLVIKPKGQPSSEEEKADEEEEEEEELDPEMKKLKEENKALRKEVEMVKGIVLTEKVEQAHKSMKNEIETLIKEKYEHASYKGAVRKLAEKDEEDKPKYTTEEAVKLDHEETEKRFKKYLEKNPDYQKKTKEEKEKIITEFQAEEAERNKAPVSSPSETSAGGAPTQKEEGDYPDAQTAYEAFKKQHKATLEAGEKS